MSGMGRVIKTKGFRRAAAGVIGLLVVGAAWAGWRLQRATDTTLIDPVPAPATAELRTGDIIVAGGVSLQSRMVRAMTRDSTYSHVGLIETTPDGLFVIHAAPSGEGDGGVGDRVARIPLSVFLTERGYVTVAVMRLSDEAVDSGRIAEDASAYAVRCAEQAVPFDAKFDLSGQDRIYCSELVYLAYQHAGYTWPDSLVTHVSTLIVDGPVITPDAFAKCDGFETVWKYSPKEPK